MVLALQQSSGGASWIALAVGAGTLSLVLLYFMVSRRGESRAVTKCAILSVWAHIILLGVAYLIDWIPDSLGEPGQGRAEIRVHWIPEAHDQADTDETHTEPVEDEVRSSEDAPQPLDDQVADVAVTNVADEALTEVVGASDELPKEESVSATEQISTVESLDQVNPSPIADLKESAQQPRPSELPVVDDDAEYIFNQTSRNVEVAETEEVSNDQRERHRSSPADASAAGTAALLVSQSRPVSVPRRYRGRSADQRRRLAEAGGGSLDTEAAVDAALEWLSASQATADGKWDTRTWGGGRELRSLPGASQSIRADTAVTGLALLAFLGAGQTHHEGAYPETVRRGLEFLIRSQANDGSLAGDASQFAAMYCHGIATLAMSEAYIMTGDAQLREVMERALRYTINTQHPSTGGWRYHRGDAGDTSQFGWQVMALVSGETAGVEIPTRTWEGARRWLKRVSLGPAGGLACYTPDRPVPSASMTAEATVCRTFLQLDTHVIADNEATAFISRHASRPGAVKDLYFSYYATLALYQRQDDRWQQWNQKLSTELLRTQRRDGRLMGSWDPDTKWGRTGGRVYTTAMACLCLETYYRYLPVYSVAIQRGNGTLR